MDIEDIKLDTFYIGSDTAVRATHLPTGKVEIWAGGTYLQNREHVLRKLAERVDPYIGDPGDENDYGRWGADGGANG